ncbi:helix-turn-helix transcriptional regulator [Mycobacteroides abscessus]|uniref:helix-turn-helix transcriptional regulator n=1 Tax=Mycobacteroides abscessus TaxID=36809 RepID=UPI00092BE6EA|nr:helix-turn-helix transcriptional regulator [Mycobacteroides abscessus]MDO2987021.1 helix-turn-helix transcriptional regulator [Mycobacteroides abscessus subsp. abscessus]RIS64158.1 helix-turn-helix domain-containing protein [Mycobacteroides abscessus]SIA19287.1 putative transcriptional regulator [Mycobacteroides abscessus subsp. abscessus]SID29874.1 putative transcriptional regulator [Mycobacteroides abscessus subsp. abscessus]SIJ90815.1 putative transcriptional regulator [Mycobacteroides a
MGSAQVRGFDREQFALLRNEKGWSFQKLHQISGIHASQLSRYESGAKVPSPESLQRLARAFEVRPEELTSIAAAERTLGDLRELAGFSQLGLAKHLGLTLSVLRELEQATGDLTVEFASDLAQALGVGIEEIREAYQRSGLEAIQLLHERVGKTHRAVVAEDEAGTGGSRVRAAASA